MDVQQLKGGRVNVGSWFEGAQSITVGKAGLQEREAARPTVSAVRKQRGRDAGAQPAVSCLFTQVPSHGTLPHSECLPTAFDPISKVPVWHTQRFISMVALSPIK